MTKNSEFSVHPINVLRDNIVWVWVAGAEAVVIDPSISKPVINWLKKNNLLVRAVLQTHHHEDHIGGTKEIIKEWPDADVIASKNDIHRIPFQTLSVKDNDLINLLGYQIKIIAVPGHTLHHIAFYITDFYENKKPILFPGDTLFAAGCGKLFEGLPIDMYMSLKKLNTLPKETKIYSAHEYTEDNLRWALSLKPKDKYLVSKLKEVKIKREHHLNSLPSTIEEERKTNLFVQAKNIKEFSNLRKLKDNWKG